MANNITNLRLTAFSRSFPLKVSNLNLLNVNFNAVNLPGGGIAGIKKYKVTCTIAEVKFSLSRNVTIIRTLSEKFQNISIGDVGFPGPMEFKFSRAALFPNGRSARGTFTAIVKISVVKGIIDMKMSNVLTLE